MFLSVTAHKVKKLSHWPRLTSMEWSNDNIGQLVIGLVFILVSITIKRFLINRTSGVVKSCRKHYDFVVGKLGEKLWEQIKSDLRELVSNMVNNLLNAKS